MGRLKSFDRLRTSREFNAVYKHADATWHTPCFVLFFRRDTTRKRVGFVAGKKVGNAVKRTRAKRLLRAHFLTAIDRLKPGQYVLVAKPPLLTQDFSETSIAFLRALKRAGALTKTPPRPPRQTSTNR